VKRKKKRKCKICNRVPFVRKPLTGISELFLLPFSFFEEVSELQATLFKDHYCRKLKQAIGATDTISLAVYKITGIKQYARAYYAVSKITSNWKDYLDFAFRFYRYNSYKKYPRLKAMFGEKILQEWNRTLAEKKIISDSLAGKKTLAQDDRILQSEHVVEMILRNRNDVKNLKEVLMKFPNLVVEGFVDRKWFEKEMREE